jgi:hypothetical protein
MDGRTEHVLDTIDGALADYDLGPDAMRWSPDPPEEPEHPAPWVLPVRAWRDAMREAMALPLDPDGILAGLSESARDLVVFGHAYADADGNRIDPTTVVRTVRGPRPSFTVVDEADLARRMRATGGAAWHHSDHNPPSVRRLDPATFRVLADPDVAIAAARALRTVRERMAHLTDTMTRVGEAFADLTEHEPSDPRERALWLRQNRNTGPTKNPHRHRGTR